MTDAFLTAKENLSAQLVANEALAANLIAERDRTDNIAIAAYQNFARLRQGANITALSTAGTPANITAAVSEAARVSEAASLAADAAEAAYKAAETENIRLNSQLISMNDNKPATAVLASEVAANTPAVTSELTSTPLTAVGIASLETAQIEGVTYQPSVGIPEAVSADDAEATVLPIDPTKLSSSANALHSYATYTYGLTLYMLTVGEFEELQASDVTKLASWIPKHALISSAGRYNKESSGTTAGREPAFNVDFYFDNMRMTTVIGSNNQTRGTNAITISFTIIEPYGLTLLDRLITTSNGPAIDSKNYLVQPYLLELDFFGADDLGDMPTPIPELKKRFPISLIECKIKATSKGSEYAIRSTPFSHNMLRETAISTPVNLEVNADTIGGFFKSTGTAIMEANLAGRAEQIAASKAKTSSNREDTLATSQGTTVAAQLAKKAYGTNSFTDAMNAWFRYNVQQSNILVADEIDFNFSKFDTSVVDSKINPSTAPNAAQSFAPVNSQAMIKANANMGTADMPSTNKFPINASTSIIEVINSVMRNSDYIKSQLVDVNEQKQLFAYDTTVKFFKIIPQITKLQYDSKRKQYATKTVYHVVPYEYFNAKHPNLPYAFPTYAVKEYNYIYTGKNLDILDFQIDFNIAYYNGVVALPGSADKGNNQVDATKENDDIAASRPMENNPKAISNYQNHMISQNTAAAAANVNSGPQHFVANALDSIYSGSRGDMIQVKLKIIGDPAFIKQDDIYTNPGMLGYDQKAVNSNGSISMDFTDIFCRINFRTPSDMDEATGLMRTEGPFVESKFSGFYKIITVDNEFSKGQFIQTLDCVRMLETTRVVKKGIALPGETAATSFRQSEINDANADSDARKLEDDTGDAFSRRHPVDTTTNAADDSTQIDVSNRPNLSTDSSDSSGSQKPAVPGPNLTAIELAKQEGDRIRASTLAPATPGAPSQQLVIDTSQLSRANQLGLGSIR